MDKSGFVQSGITAEMAINSIFKGEDRQKLILEKNKKYVADVFGKEITVNYKPAAKLRNYFKDMSPGNTFYDPHTSLKYILSPEEVIRRESENNPKFYNTDAYLFATCELDIDKLTALPYEEVKDRFFCFAEICKRVANEAVLQLIAENAAKKKDGFLHKGRVMPIAAFMCAYEPCNILELTAKSISNTEIEINIQSREFNMKDYNTVTQNQILEELMSCSNSDRKKEPPKSNTPTEYVTITCNLKSSTGGKLKLPVVKLEDGRFALDVEPKIALSDFECLEGTDKKGYELVPYKTFQATSVNYKGNILPIAEFGVPFVSGRWSCLMRHSKFLSSNRQGQTAFTELRRCFSMNPDDDEMFRQNFINEQALLEHAYELFFSIDAITRYYRNIDLQNLADTAPVYEDSGKLVKYIWWVAAIDSEEEQGANNKSSRREGDIKEYLHNTTFVYRKKPMLIPFIGWSGSTKNGFNAQVRFYKQVDWK